VELDNDKEFKNLDRSDMLGMIHSLPDDMERLLDGKFDFPKIKTIDGIAICGMGGSAIGGDILRECLANTSEIPISVFRGYDLPASVGKNSLVLVVSFSGNTEETLSMYKAAISRDCTVIALSTGGHLMDLAAKDGVSHIKIDTRAGTPPRAALGHLLVPMALLFEHLGIADVKQEITETIMKMKVMREEMGPAVPTRTNQAKHLAKKLENKLPVIHGYGPMVPVAYRWKTQINENSKAIAWHDPLPEMNHNSIVGWGGDRRCEKNVAIFLRDFELEQEKAGAMKKRVVSTVGILSARNVEVVEEWTRGNTLLTRMMSLIYLGDFTSTYLAMLRDVDPAPVEAIEDLKKQLARM
jgi:glucose/mannose-6-phosphate isomerase